MDIILTMEVGPLLDMHPAGLQNGIQQQTTLREPMSTVTPQQVRCRDRRGPFHSKLLSWAMMNFYLRLEIAASG